MSRAEMAPLSWFLWVRPAATSAEGHPLRFTAHDNAVWAHVLADDVAVVTVPGIVATPATVVSIGGSAASWTSTPDGLRVEVGAPVSRPAVGFHAAEAG